MAEEHLYGCMDQVGVVSILSINVINVPTNIINNIHTWMIKCQISNIHPFA